MLARPLALSSSSAVVCSEAEADQASVSKEEPRMKGQRIAMLSCLGLLSLAGPSATAQPVVKRVKYKVSCPGCAIELTPVVTIGGPSDTVSIAPHSFLDRDSQ